MALYRIKARWTGFTGSPGYSVFHFDAATEANETTAASYAAAVRAFFQAVGSYLPNSARVTIEAGVEVISETTGDLEGIITLATPPATVTGGDSGSYSAASGACVTWDTSGIRRGRRVRGRTFLVPLGTSAFQTDGTLNSTFLTALTGAASTLVNGNFGFGVFSRPTSSTASDGNFFGATGGRVSDKAAVLRSRRD